jgi:hypothetical protein
MRIALAVIAILFPDFSRTQGDVWSLELLERYAAWVRDGGFACPMATRITEVGPADGGTAFKVSCSPAASPLTGVEVAFRVMVHPDDSRRVERWRE